MKENNSKIETAQEVPVQEQYNAKIGFDDQILEEKLQKINTLANELKQEINSLPSTLKITYQNS